MVIPVYNSATQLRSCLEHLRRSSLSVYECIVVDDGSTDNSAGVARDFGATVLLTGGRCGPAIARNVGAQAAQNEILVFVDSDVCVHNGALERIAASFAVDPELAAVMGSYDDDPGSPDFISRYRNLMHCYVHRHGRREASTFWSGCGAIRRSVFLEFKGFDESYSRPSIEDIELGYRLAKAKKKLMLDPGLMVKHLKHWDFVGLVKTDVLDRGIPWTELILRHRTMPNDLNLKFSQRISVALMFVSIAIAAMALLYSGRAFVLTVFTFLFLALAQVVVSRDWKMRPVFAVSMLCGVGIISYLAIANGIPRLIPMVLIACLMLLGRHHFTFGTTRRKRITGSICGAYLAFVMLYVLLRLPQHPAMLGFGLALSAIVLLNIPFYFFLAGRMGRLHALAAIPFHLFFFFYSGLSFLFGLGKYFLRPRQSTVGQASACKEL